jgi:WD40 repeat protein/energy-coupling factor transporter ATP-binding protein EcfA2
MNGLADVQIRNPFPGLRPFRRNEDFLFFGRESQVDAMVDKLAQTGFLAVVGPSGSGKSSLVNCGLEPALHRGLMAKAGTNWHVAHMRPGIDPFGHLADALAKSGVLFTDYDSGHLTTSEIIEATLRMSKLGLIDIVQQARLPEQVNLLVVVDQFEELFRYSKLVIAGQKSDSEINEDAVAFVNLLLETTNNPELPIYIVLTMRSDFFGDCAKFAGLPEAINAGQYLIPRMKRDERRAAITGPIHVSGSEISPVLVTRLVNDVGDNPDQLSILQHALNRTWAYWENICGREGPLDLKHYEAIGTMASALDAHAERAFGELESEAQKKICEKMFKALTDKATDPRGIRRPAKFPTLCKLTRASETDLEKVIGVFRKPSRSFLMPPVGEELEPDTVVDISHESLMRGWKRLRRWADEEAESARTFTRLAEAAELYEDKKASLWRDPELQLALDWKAREQPTEEWARQYRSDFERADRFLQASRLRHQLKYSAKVLSVVIAAVALAAGSWLLRETVEAENARIAAEVRAVAADALSEAEHAATEALSGDPIEGSLIALRNLATLRGNPSDAEYGKAFRKLESALWQSHARTHLRKILDGHEQELRSAAFNRHGTLLATGSYDGTARIYDTQTWELVRVIQEDDGDDVRRTSRVLGVRFSPDGEYLATGSSAYPKGLERKGRVRLWNVETGEKAMELIESDDEPFAHSGPVRTVSFSSSGERIATSSYDNTARIWQVRDGKLLRTLEGHRMGDYGVDVYDAVFHPKNYTIVATGGNDGVVRLWDLNKPNEENIPFVGHNNRIKSVAFSPDGKSLISASDDDTVRVWDAEKRIQDGRALEAHWANIWRAIYDEEGARLFTASWDRTIGIWNADTFNLNYRLRGHNGPIRTLDYNLFQQWLASGSTDLTARIWTLESDDIHYRITSHEDDVTVVRVNPADPSIFATGSEDGTVRIWKIGSQFPKHILDDETQSCEVLNWLPQCSVEHVAFTQDGSRLAARYADRTVRFWDPKTGKQTGNPIQAEGLTSSAMVTMDQPTVIAANINQNRISIFDLANGDAEEKSFIDMIPALQTVDLNPGSWSSRISAMGYNAVRGLLAVGLNGGIVLIWDTGTGELLPPLKILKGPVSSIRFNNDGTIVFAAVFATFAVEAWDISENRKISEMRGHKGEINDLTVIGNGERLVSTGDDETVRIWDTASGEEIGSLPGHTGTVRSLALVPDRDILISASNDRTVIVRDIFEDLEQLIDRICVSLKSKALEAGGYLEDGESLEVLCRSAGVASQFMVSETGESKSD